MEDVICKLVTPSHTLSDIKVRFLKAERELCSVKVEMDALIGKVSVRKAEPIVDRDKRRSLQAHTENCAVSPEKKKQNRKLNCFDVDMKYVGTA